MFFLWTKAYEIRCTFWWRKHKSTWNCAFRISWTVRG